MLAVMFPMFPRSHMTELNAARAKYSNTLVFTKVVRFTRLQHFPIRYKVTGDIWRMEADVDTFFNRRLIWGPTFELPRDTINSRLTYDLLKMVMRELF